MMTLVFDLDDTLYDETTFVKSGFNAVAKYIEQRFQIPQNVSYEFMVNKLSIGRGKIFDDILKHYNIFNKSNVRKCLSVYRLHYPDIKLYDDADRCLTRFSKYSMFIVTDGNKLVQNNKILALGLNNRVKKPFITHRYGIRYAKPSPYCFFKIAEEEKVSNNEIIYIGDNPEKDFVGIKPYGFKTIRIMRGAHSAKKLEAKYEAHYRVNSLDELTEDFLVNIIADN